MGLLKPHGMIKNNDGLLIVFGLQYHNVTLESCLTGSRQVQRLIRF